MSSDNAFSEIQVIGIDESRLQLINPKYSPLLSVYFQLSETPPSKWIKIFKGQTAFLPPQPNPDPFDIRKSNDLDGNYLYIHITLEEINQQTLDSLKKYIAGINDKYREYLKEQSLLEQRQKREEEDFKQKVKDAISSLKFD